MPLIVAIEPDGRQAAQLLKLARGSLNAKLVVAESTAQALGTFNEGVPDLILTSPRLSKKDEKALADRLKALDGAAAHVQRLTIPLLGAAGPARGKRHVVRAKRSSDSLVEGCDPELFAQRIAEYLELAAAERALLDAGSRGGAVATGASPTAKLAVEQPRIEAKADPPVQEPHKPVHEPPSIGRMLDEVLSRPAASARSAAAKAAATPRPGEPAHTATVPAASTEPATEPVRRDMDLTTFIEQVLGPDAVEPIALEPIAPDAEVLESLALEPESFGTESPTPEPAVKKAADAPSAIELGDINSLDLSTFVHQLEASAHIEAGAIELVPDAIELAAGMSVDALAQELSSTPIDPPAGLAAEPAAEPPGEMFQVDEFDRSMLVRFGEHHPNDFTNATADPTVASIAPDTAAVAVSQLPVSAESAAGPLLPELPPACETTGEARLPSVLTDTERVLESVEDLVVARAADWAGVLTPIAWPASAQSQAVADPAVTTDPTVDASAAHGAIADVAPDPDTAAPDGRRKGSLLSRFHGWLSAHRPRLRSENTDVVQRPPDREQSPADERVQPGVAVTGPMETLPGPAREDLAQLFDAIESTKEVAAVLEPAAVPELPIAAESALDVEAAVVPVQPVVAPPPAAELPVAFEPPAVSEALMSLDLSVDLETPLVAFVTPSSPEPPPALPALDDLRAVAEPPAIVEESVVVEEPVAPIAVAAAGPPAELEPEVVAFESWIASLEGYPSVTTAAMPAPIADSIDPIPVVQIGAAPVLPDTAPACDFLGPPTVTRPEIVVGEPWAIDSAVEDTGSWMACPLVPHAWPRLDWVVPEKASIDTSDEDPSALPVNVADVEIAPEPVRRQKPRIRKKSATKPPAADEPTRKGERPIQDEWGMFDPEQCGIAALFAKLGIEEVPETVQRRPRNRRH